MPWPCTPRDLIKPRREYQVSAMGKLLWTYTSTIKIKQEVQSNHKIDLLSDQYFHDLVSQIRF